MSNNKDQNSYKYRVSPICPLQGLEDQINYKNVALLKKYVSTRGRILPRERTGVCAKNQKILVREIKRARYMALLPFTQYV